MFSELWLSYFWALIEFLLKKWLMVESGLSIENRPFSLFGMKHAEWKQMPKGQIVRNWRMLSRVICFYGGLCVFSLFWPRFEKTKRFDFLTFFTHILSNHSYSTHFEIFLLWLHRLLTLSDSGCLTVSYLFANFLVHFELIFAIFTHFAYLNSFLSQVCNIWANLVLWNTLLFMTFSST